MGKDKGRTFTELKDSMTFNELTEFCRRVASTYAHSSWEFAREYCTKHFKITESAYYLCLEKAVIWGLVTDEEVKLMEEKASHNSKMHAGVAIRTVLYYEDLVERREEYANQAFSKTKEKKIGTSFANDLSLTEKDLCNMYNLTEPQIVKAIYFALTNNLVSNRTFTRLKARSLSKNNSEELKKIFDELESKRRGS